MNLKPAIWVLLTLLSSVSLAQTVTKCDGSVLSHTSDKIGKLSEKEVADFLFTFDAECRNNVEYTEWSNELLFDVLETQPQLMLTTIEKEKTVDLKEILKAIESPLLDEDIDKLMAKVKETKATPKLKQTVLDKLTIAKDGLKN